MVRIARMFIILLFGVAAGAPLQANIPSSERDALIAIYNATGGPNWHHNYGWEAQEVKVPGAVSYRTKIGPRASG